MNARNSRLGRALVFAALLLGLTGCTDTSGSARGVVQFSDGEPVQSGSIEFRSLADGACYASRIAVDGTFTLTDADGNLRCPPGEYEVVVVQMVITEDLAAADHQHGRTVPRRFADYYTSGLRLTKTPEDVSPWQVILTIEASESIR